MRSNSGVIRSSAKLTVIVKRPPEPEYRGVQMMEQKQEIRRVEVEEKLPDAPKFTKVLQDLAAAEGSNLHLEAQVSPTSDSTMRIEWLKDGKAITASSRIGTLFSFGYVSLNIVTLRVEDEGRYTCKVDG